MLHIGVSRARENKCGTVRIENAQLIPFRDDDFVTVRAVEVRHRGLHVAAVVQRVGGQGSSVDGELPKPAGQRRAEVRWADENEPGLAGSCSSGSQGTVSGRLVQPPGPVGGKQVWFQINIRTGSVGDR